MRISVVIPVLNEIENLPDLIADLREIADCGELIVSDGGSSDGTREWVAGQNNILLMDAPRGKGPQLNSGATRATGDILLFLHADCRMNRETWKAFQSALAGSRIAGGAFHVRFLEKEPYSLRVVEQGINARTTMTRTATGDQGIFVRRDVFATIGGAPDWPLFEDVELVRRIKNAGKFVVVKAPLIISGRRYIKHGVIRTAMLIFLLRLGFWLGLSPQRLKKWFEDVR
ncbi:MAG TPA: TIGR04283 family arsenosugar biosynthesis glycosyltransferase [Candidatus Angelobacter sp.]|jgi:rSAM/selenodomain-associated transferase 2|nr:TIGR04283 family arsenosugar biosynthesis glycosyltransferase [Candidatus Angelobacter sp.]